MAICHTTAQTRRSQSSLAVAVAVAVAAAAAHINPEQNGICRFLLLVAHND